MNNNYTAQVSLSEKFLLTVKEAAQYFGIGENKIRELTDIDNYPSVLWVGTKRMIKRTSFETFLLGEYSV